MQSTGGLMWARFITRAVLVLPTRRALVTMAMATRSSSSSSSNGSNGNGSGSKPAKRALRGVVFDMDGTLTVPCIDFRAMYRRVLGEDHPSVVNNSPIDILHEISSWSPDKQVRAYAIITEVETEAHEKLQIMPGASEVAAFLDARDVRRGLITRNVRDSVDVFHTRFAPPKFSPALSREFTPCKPSAAPLLHICQAWGVSPAQVMMVGDSAADDVVCGNRAGALTCLLDERGRYHLPELPQEQVPTHKIQSLFELNSLLETYDLQFPVMPS